MDDIKYRKARRRPNRRGGRMVSRLVGLLVATALLTGTFVVATAVSASAWVTGQSAVASCEGPQVVITGTFHNNEPDSWGTKGDMSVTMVLGDKKDGPKVVLHQDSGTFAINTGLSVLGAGKVRFDLLWADGRPGYDKRYADFNAFDCRTPVKPAITQTKPNCDNPNITATGVAEQGVTWTPESVKIAPGKTDTLTAGLDDTVILAEGGQTVFNVVNTFDPGTCFVAHKNPKGHVKCGCKGDPSGVMNNSKSNVTVTYKARAVLRGNVVFTQTVEVKAGAKRDYSFGGHRIFKPGTKLVLKAVGTVLDTDKVGPKCPKPPHSGLPKVVVPKVLVPKA